MEKTSEDPTNKEQELDKKLGECVTSYCHG